jgi:hypothetical protein
MDYQAFGLKLVKEFQNNFGNFEIINNTQQNTKTNIIVNNYYIIHLTGLNKYLICECYEKTVRLCTFKIFATYENGLIDIISDFTYVEFDFTTRYDVIEFIKWNKYEKCIIYKKLVSYDTKNIYLLYNKV